MDIRVNPSMRHYLLPRPLGYSVRTLSILVLAFIISPILSPAAFLFENHRHNVQVTQAVIHEFNSVPKWRGDKLLAAWQSARIKRDADGSDLVARDAEHYLWMLSLTERHGPLYERLASFHLPIGYFLVKLVVHSTFPHAKIFGRYPGITPPTMDGLAWGIRGAWDSATGNSTDTFLKSE